MENPFVEPETLKTAREKIHTAAMEVRRHLRTLPEFGKKHRPMPGVMIDCMSPRDEMANDIF